MNSSIEFNNYYKKIMFPIYYPVLAGKSYHTTREIPHIYKGYIETIIYPKIEELEVSFKDEDKRFLPDIGNCFPTPHIVRDNSIIWITGRNLNHTDLYASFDNTVQKIGRERTDFIYGVIITALISLLLFFIQTLISLAVKTA